MYIPIGLHSGTGGSTSLTDSIPFTWELDVGKRLIYQGYGRIQLDALEANAFLFDAAQITTITKAVRFGNGDSFITPTTYTALRNWLSGTAALVGGANADGNLAAPTDATYWELSLFVNENSNWLENQVRAIFQFTRITT